MIVRLRTAVVLLGEDGSLLLAGDDPRAVHAEVAHVDPLVLVSLAGQGQPEGGEVHVKSVLGPGAHHDVTVLLLIRILHCHHLPPRSVGAVHGEADWGNPDDSAICCQDGVIVRLPQLLVSIIIVIEVLQK